MCPPPTDELPTTTATRTMSNTTRGDSQAAAKKLKTDFVLTDYVTRHVIDDEEEHRKRFAKSKPYRHGLLEGLFQPDFLTQVKEEIKRSSKVNFKESDLFRVYQSIDMANLTEEEHAEALPTVLQLRRVLYSDSWRSLIERICGLETGTLTGKVDCACNCHATGCHLLCHDDVIGTRKISYIIYLTDDDWSAKEGGALELYDRISDRTSSGSISSVPSAIPSATLLPFFNNMAFFKVEPGVSFHAVQEVLGDRPRLSLQGWYHAADLPKQIESATLQQLKTVGDDQEPYTAIQYPTPAPAESKRDGSPPELSSEHCRYLSEYLHETYLTKEAIKNIREQFEEDSSVQLRNFFRDEWINRINSAREKEEKDTSRPVGDRDYYSQGARGDWKLVGPAHKQRFLEFKALSNGKLNGTGEILNHLKSKVFCSTPFQHFLACITSLGLPVGQRGKVRRFRKGLDYTVAHYGILTKQSVLDATMSFVAGSGQQVKPPSDNEEDTPGEDGNDKAADMLWESGDCGGFECYIAADESDEAADEYNQDDDTELLSVSASNNTLSLVYRDPGTMRFVKYIGSTAPSSRFDIAMEFEVEDDDEEEQKANEVDDVDAEEHGF